MASEVVKKAECGCCGIWEKCTLVEVALQVHANFREAAHADPAARIAHSILQLIKKMLSSSLSTKASLP
ncbi:hypothetical protein CJ030_MR2G007122 [Morella rubra]|uniref:Uncharacterized protein n=1 Tax=Morella rubra TaxID=262757 RepID=A0A6A1WGY9_9ROSI|nr:hypothetical protein CJ030_MR2G007122 [Morella rubra]